MRIAQNRVEMLLITSKPVCGGEGGRRRNVIVKLNTRKSKVEYEKKFNDLKFLENDLWSWLILPSYSLENICCFQSSLSRESMMDLPSPYAMIKYSIIKSPKSTWNS